MIGEHGSMTSGTSLAPHEVLSLLLVLVMGSSKVVSALSYRISQNRNTVIILS